MDTVKAGRFIAQLRKQKGLTQEQLGNRLGVSNKTVSRWETGTYLPPADVLLEMSGLFGVSVNELLSGRRLEESEFKQAAEENLTQVLQSGPFYLKDRIAFYKQKWIREHIPVLILAGICLACILAAGILLGKPLYTAAASVFFVLAHAWRHNTMMTYIEQHAYDGSGPGPEEGEGQDG